MFTPESDIVVFELHLFIYLFVRLITVCINFRHNPITVNDMIIKKSGSRENVADFFFLLLTVHDRSQLTD